MTLAHKTQLARFSFPYQKVFKQETWVVGSTIKQSLQYDRSFTFNSNHHVEPMNKLRNIFLQAQGGAHCRKHSHYVWECFSFIASQPARNNMSQTERA